MNSSIAFLTNTVFVKYLSLFLACLCLCQAYRIWSTDWVHKKIQPGYKKAKQYLIDVRERIEGCLTDEQLLALCQTIPDKKIFPIVVTANVFGKDNSVDVDFNYQYNIKQAMPIFDIASKMNVNQIGVYFVNKDGSKNLKQSLIKAIDLAIDDLNQLIDEGEQK